MMRINVYKVKRKSFLISSAKYTDATCDTGNDKLSSIIFFL